MRSGSKRGYDQRFKVSVEIPHHFVTGVGTLRTIELTTQTFHGSIPIQIDPPPVEGEGRRLRSERIPADDVEDDPVAVDLARPREILGQMGQLENRIHVARLLSES